MIPRVNWYDRAEIYDVLFGWDPRAEIEFILGASASSGIASPRRVLEPFCGSGRLLRPFPGAVGFDLNPFMVRYAERDGIRVEGYAAVLGDADPGTRVEAGHFRMDVHRAGRFERIESFQPLRVYSRRQFEVLIDGEGAFEIAAAFDRRYDLSDPVELDEIAGSAVLVLRRP